MAGYGSEYARYAKHATPDTASATPTFEAPVSLGAFVQGDLAITNAEGEQYGDNTLQEKMMKFASGAIPLQVTDLPKASAAVVYGATYNPTNHALSFGGDDVAPYGAYGYIRNIMRAGVEVFEGNFFPKVIAARTTQPSQSRNNSITLQNDTINLTVMRPLHKATKWQYTEEYATFAEAAAWLAEMFGTNLITGGTIAAETVGAAGEDITADPIFSGSPEPTSGITYLWQYFNAGVWTNLTDSYTGYNTATLTTVDNQDEDVEFRCAITYNDVTVYTNSLIMT